MIDLRADAIIHVTFTANRLHRWPSAEGKRAYLASMHRHLFAVKVSCAVRHDDREIEFHDLIDQARRTFDDLVPGESDLSCETMARLLGSALAARYDRGFQIEVWEDSECGATVYSEPPRE